MPSRSRSRTHAQSTNGVCVTKRTDGSVVSTVSRPPSIGFRKETEDFVGNPNGVNYFNSVTSTATAEGVNGLYTVPGTGGWTRDFSDFRLGIFDQPGANAGSLSMPAHPSLGVRRTELIKRTNPSRPEADLAVTFGELKNLPRAVFEGGEIMVKEAVRRRRGKPVGERTYSDRNLFREGASGYLGVQFGLKPLISDVRAIVDAQSRIARRFAELKKLQTGYLKRRVSFDSIQINESPSSVILHSASPMTFNGKRTRVGTSTSWGTVRWKVLSTETFPNNDADLQRLALRAAYGLHIDLVTAWNLMPWSWLLDYFFNVGDYLAASRNEVGCYPTDTCIMTHVTKMSILSAETYPGLSGGGGLIRHETKTRHVVGGTDSLLATFPALTGSQVSNMGALAITRMPK